MQVVPREIALHYRRWLLACAALCLLGACCNWIVFPFPHEKLHRPHGTFVYASDGHLINCFTASDRTWRKPVPLADISPLLRASVIANEDRWFRWHPGFNPVSLFLAACDNVAAGKFVRGGSTITMQIARMIEPKERTIGNKLIELFRAMQLELAYTKDELLDIYLNLAPYGGNIEGVGAAAYLYFGKGPQDLSPSEVAILTAIPASPNQFRPDANPVNCRSRRDQVLRKLLAESLIDSAAFAQSCREEIPTGRVAPAVTAPHFSQMLALRYPEKTEIRSTIDFNLQSVCEQLAAGFQQSLSGKGINNLAVVVIDTRTSELRALVGSANFGDTKHQGQVNGAVAPRSPGSALKPFVYGLAFDEGLISPELRLEDLPVNYAGYTPVNYDGEYHGLVPVSEALIQSLNVPAVNLASRVGIAKIYELLKQGGLSTLHRKYHQYGLPLVLGSCEVNLLELTNLYAMLGRGGMFQRYRLVSSDSLRAAERLLSPESAYLLAETLSELKRPDLPSSWEFTTDMPRVAWKTGTSYGRKDAWAIGFNPEYTVGVWAGNFTAEGSIAIVGAEVAAPLMLAIFDHLYSDQRAPWYTVPAKVLTRQVCAVSGMPASDACPTTISEHYVAGVSPTRSCTVHQQILVDASTGFKLCPFCSAGNRAVSKLIERWPPKLAAWLQRRGIISTLPMHNPACRGTDQGESPVITSPEQGATYLVQEQSPLEYQKILFEAAAGTDADKLHWFLDGRLFATSSNSDSRIFYTPERGEHRLICVDALGRSSRISFRVE